MKTMLLGTSPAIVWKSPITALIIIFTFIVILTFIVFYFQYKGRKERYRLAEQTLTSGQPFPESLFKNKSESTQEFKGIKKTFLGFGLFIFLWAITGEFSIGSIGLLIMSVGIGQWIIDNKTARKLKENTPNNEKAE